ncbi:MAG: LLM class flavin-dependent oxidoreductase, partial [Pseudomonadales bacterium]|nr:LLM class flavin-dependent oxidoreductase [Pseudomonadales bacterium]
LHQLFERQAQIRPQSTALTFRDQSISYAELNNQVNRLALTLQALGAKPDQLIGLFIERSIDMVVGLLAILKSGAAYVPLDPSYPHDRIDLMIADSQASILLTHSSLSDRLPTHDSAVVYIDKQLLDISVGAAEGRQSLIEAVTPSHLAYVIYTSGSTGIPKGVMVEHRNVLNFMAGMDDSLNYSGEPGVWLAVTSISFDISVLEIFWSLTRGFKVVIQEEDAITLGATSPPSEQQSVSLVNRDMAVGLFYFSSDAGPNTAGDRYKLLLEGAKFADSHNFSTVWTPERHFHLFGGLYPNPSVTSAAVAAVTQNIAIRAGSIVLPLHNPIRVAEEWSVVDNLSNGRVGFSFASGWHVNDFALKPENFANRRQLMFDEIETVRKLWRGETIEILNGEGKPFEARIYPPAIQKDPPIWITTAGNIDTFRAAGEGGFNILTNLLGQTIEDLTSKIAAYRQGRKDKGFAGPGNVSVMVHTFIGTDVDEVRDIVREPFCHYLKTSFDLVKIAPWAFPAFKQPSKAAAQDSSFDADTLTDEDLDALIDHAFDRYFEAAGLFGTATSVLPLLDQIKSAGIDEIACLIDFGVDNETVLDNLQHLNQLRINSNPEQYKSDADYSIAAQIKRHDVTHFQCTPSMARILSSDPDTFSAMANLHTVLLGGEALPVDLAKKMQAHIKGQLINVYGPTETTIWSTSALLTAEVLEQNLSIGQPIANTQIYIVDKDLQPTPIGIAGELMIGGQGVVRGYHRRAELTAEKFIANPFSLDKSEMDTANQNGQSKKVDLIYRTGDLASYRVNGDIEFLGRLDHQVKLRGYRIELGEIESLLNTSEGIKNSVVIATESEFDQPQSLIAYVVADKTLPQQENSHWQTIWDEAYDNGNTAVDLVQNREDKEGAEESIESATSNDPTFNISG